MKMAAGGAVTQRAVAGPRQSTRAREGSPIQEALPLFPNLETDPARANASADGFDKTPACTPATENAESTGEEGA